jgi:hypothetical protein
MDGHDDRRDRSLRSTRVVMIMCSSAHADLVASHHAWLSRNRWGRQLLLVVTAELSREAGLGEARWPVQCDTLKSRCDG